MGRVNDDQWLDEALNRAIHTDDTRPDFEKWKADHPEAVEMLTSRTRSQGPRPHQTWRDFMNTTFVKIAAAAVIAVAGIVGITRLTHHPADNPSPGEPVTQETVVGPTTCMFADGSSARLSEGASIRTLAATDRRGFVHVAGRIEVTVAKGKGEFIVTTPCSEVKALGTQFTLDLVEGVAENTKQPVKLLNVEVTEGSVEVRNAQGVQTLKPAQNAIVAMDTAPYDFNQDEDLPEGLRQRIAAMVQAFETADRAAWAANFNLEYVYKLGKGEAQYDPNLFGGSAEDAAGLQQAVAGVKSLEEMKQLFLGTINITEPVEVYVRSVGLSRDGKHARAECVQRKNANRIVITTPQWHNFDSGWWQIDD